LHPLSHTPVVLWLQIQLNRPLANLEPKGYPRSKGLGAWGQAAVRMQTRSKAQPLSTSMTGVLVTPSWAALCLLLSLTPAVLTLPCAVLWCALPHCNAGFWKWNFVATKRSEKETHSSSCYTQSDLSSPPTCLPNYVDGDSIRRKDLVVWVNSGLYHVPMAEDAPVTPASGHNQLGFSLMYVCVRVLMGFRGGQPQLCKRGVKGQSNQQPPQLVMLPC
jgi:hypothetical protein